MAAEEEKRSDFYGVLGLKKECSAAELRNAYKKLALRWHPDRCSASGNSKYVEEAKKKFQAIQEAYSVLSDVNKRFMYDVGVYDCDDDENGMGDFLNEMAVMMTQNMSNKNGEESFEELQELFKEMFQSEAFGSTSQNVTPNSCSRRNIIKIRRGKKQDEEFQEVLEIDGMAGNKRFHLATTSRLVPILIFLLEEGVMIVNLQVRTFYLIGRVTR
ncbi:chaperone DnaJ-domain superfamily protein [Actinidia rufa]|uniref:Chaperone DnaJ-domain superfamily protein n=1 Tax=Actinidia rufa TaxID=165716 RepID=A0A7J0GLH0_9ERIC|nr:chaperone DnaJ-domain superfamily protein [Actinidia rufa]